MPHPVDPKYIPVLTEVRKVWMDHFVVHANVAEKFERELGFDIWLSNFVEARVQARIAEMGLEYEERLEPRYGEDGRREEYEFKVGIRWRGVYLSNRVRRLVGKWETVAERVHS